MSSAPVAPSSVRRGAGQVPSDERYGRPASGWRARLFRVIFESDTRAGLLFDQALIVLILLSLVVVVADSVGSLQARWGGVFNVLEWTFTLLFTLEYVLRLLCVTRPLRYARSFFGVIDLLAILPTYLALFVPELHALIDVRILRLLRVFRIFKLTTFISEYQAMGSALLASWRKIMVFLSAVLMIVVVMGTVMYVVEGPANGFVNIPTAIYWAITTMTTVGFGDITPKTDFGRLIASMMMLLGWGTLAVPTGIVTAEMTIQRRDQAAAAGARQPDRVCQVCGQEGHASQAAYCHHCGSSLAR
ncbi:ion transporter [Hydrogenophaga sp. OTU3427]|uniref:ion transporter n=1 Tax=Hydrogenophaga sp. OTU3427 TaxID=3043856 RepID=UPI00313EF177